MYSQGKPGNDVRMSIGEDGPVSEPTLAPSAASLYAMAAPIPRAAPVTIAFFPSRGKPVTLALLVPVMVEDPFWFLYLRYGIRTLE